MSEGGNEGPGCCQGGSFKFLTGRVLPASKAGQSNGPAGYCGWQPQSEGPLGHRRHGERVNREGCLGRWLEGEIWG